MVKTWPTLVKQWPNLVKEWSTMVKHGQEIVKTAKNCQKMATTGPTMFKRGHTRSKKDRQRRGHKGPTKGPGHTERRERPARETRRPCPASCRAGHGGMIWCQQVVASGRGAEVFFSRGLLKADGKHVFFVFVIFFFLFCLFFSWPSERWRKIVFFVFLCKSIMPQNLFFVRKCVMSRKLVFVFCFVWLGKCVMPHFLLCFCLKEKKRGIPEKSPEEKKNKKRNENRSRKGLPALGF